MRCEDCSNEVTPLLVLDVDNNIADWTGHFLGFLKLYLGLSDDFWWKYDGSVELSEWLGLEKRIYQDAKLAFRTGGLKRWMPIIPHTRKLVRTARDIGMDIAIATTRPWARLDNMDPDTKEWLRRNGIKFTTLVYGDDKYEELVRAVDARRVVLVLEDQSDLCNQALGVGLNVRQTLGKWNRGNLIPGIGTSISTATHELPMLVEEWRGSR